MKILFLGPKENATTRQRILALEELGHELEIVYDRIIGKKYNLFTRIYRYLVRISGSRAEENNENKLLLIKANKFKPDLIFITKGLTIKASTITKLRKLDSNVKIICYSLDDIMNPGNQSSKYLKAVPLYDMHFTTKTYNIPELYDYGAKKVLLHLNSYSKHIHKPLQLSENDKLRFGSDVSFVGGYEKDRGEILLQLAKRGIVIRIWGNNWKKYPHKHKNLIIEYKPAYGIDYTKVLCASKICLGFLRKINRDTITTRSVEIPATKSFFLAERTEDHTNLFKEGIEADYFDNIDELFQKINFYIENDEKRQKISLNGYKKILSLNLSYNDTMKVILDQVFENEK